MTFLKMVDLDLTQKRVLIRVDLNVPLEQGRITSLTRIEAILPTVRLALEQGARVILMSHLGRPKEGVFDPAFSLAPVAQVLSQLLQQPVHLMSLEACLADNPFEIVLLENTRFLQGEKENNPELSQQLASLGDVFVMDAFATAHRKQASTYGVAEFAKVACAGPLLVSEITALHRIMQDPQRPLVAIVGGSKVSTKLSVLKHLLSWVDVLIVGGGIANTFLAAKGLPIGRSLYEAAFIKEAQDLLAYAAEHHKQIPLPTDVVVAQSFEPSAAGVLKPITAVNEDELILDVGPQTRQVFAGWVTQARTVLWNGPVGVFEWDQFAQGTHSLAEAIAQSAAYSVAGGGDTLAAIEKYHLQDKISYISTGGGAFLEFLEGKKLPAVEILEARGCLNPSTIEDKPCEEQK